MTQPLPHIKATSEDMPRIAAMFRECFRSTYPDFPELHSAAEDLEYFSNTIFPKDSIYTYQEDDKILGFVAFNDEWIDHLYILKEAQRKGIGSMLLGIAKTGRRSLKLWTFQENIPARSFYEKHGFRPTKFTDGDNEEKQPDVLYEWSAE